LSKNTITGDEIKSKVNNQEYEEGYDRIFRVKREEIVDEAMIDVARESLNFADKSTKRVTYNEYDKLFKYQAGSLDAAYERRAMMQGLITKPLFDENKEMVGDEYSHLGTLVKEVEWPDSEERIDVIGQNGNVGYTITEIDNSNPWCTKVDIEEKES
jgi:hypothetical protein